MKEPAWHRNGYEVTEGELELRADALLFNRKNRHPGAGTFAARVVVWKLRLLGLLLNNPYEPFMAIPRAEIRGAYPSPNSPTEFAVYTTREVMLVFDAQHRAAWLQALGQLPPAPG